LDRHGGKSGDAPSPSGSSIVADERSSGEIFGTGAPISTKKEKRTKKKESLLQLPQPWKSTKVAFGGFSLMISTSCLKKPPHKTLRLFHSSNRLHDC
jgi:hypothetical protein